MPRSNSKEEESKKIECSEDIHIDSIDMETLFNPLSSGNKYQTSLEHLKPEEAQFQIKTEKEKKITEQNFLFKEKIFYNNFPNENIFESGANPTNLYFYQNIYEPHEDFDNENFKKLINMRQKYLLSIYDNIEKNRKKSEIEQKKEEKTENNKEKDDNDSKENSNQEEKIKKDVLYSLFNDLLDMLNYAQDKNNLNLHFSIIDRIFNNIFFEIQTFFDKGDLIKHSFYEKKLCECIDAFEKNFLEKTGISEKNIHFLSELQKITLNLKSCGSFLKILDLMKSYKIAFDNYQEIFDNYFKINISDIKKVKKLEESDSFQIDLNLSKNNTFEFEFCTDKNYLYLFNYENQQKIYKFLLKNGKKLVETRLDQDYTSICLLNDQKYNKLNILTYDKNKKDFPFRLLVLFKDDLTIEKNIPITIPKNEKEISKNAGEGEIKYYLLSSLNYFYLIKDKKIFCINPETVIQSYNNDKMKIQEFILFKENKKNFVVDKSYYFILDDYIIFNANENINLINKTINLTKDHNKTNSTERRYFDNYNNRLYFISFIKTKTKKNLSFSIYQFENLQLIFVDSFFIPLLNQVSTKISDNFKLLSEKFPDTKKNSETDIENSNNDFNNYTDDPFKYFLNYTNDIELIINNKEFEKKNNSNYKVDEELSKNYFNYLYNAIIKYYQYYAKKDNELKNNMIINTYNEIMFNIIKNYAGNNNDFLLLYIYSYFLKQYENVEGFDSTKKIEWIINYSFEKEITNDFIFIISKQLYDFAKDKITTFTLSKELNETIEKQIKKDKLKIEDKIKYLYFVDLSSINKSYKSLDLILNIEREIILFIIQNKHNQNNITQKLYYEICENVLDSFRKIKNYKDFFTEDNISNFIELLKVFIKNGNEIIKTLTNVNENIIVKNKLVKYSLTFRVLFILINLIILNKNIFSEKISLLKLFKESLYLLQEYYKKNRSLASVKNNNHCLKKEEILIIKSDHPCNQSSLKPDYKLSIKENDNNNLFMNYDYETNYPNRLHLNGEVGFTGIPSDINGKELTYQKNIILYEENADKKLNNYYGFGVKISNFNNGECLCYNDLLLNIRKSILYMIKIFSAFYENEIKENINKENDKRESYNEEELNKIIDSKLFIGLNQDENTKDKININNSINLSEIKNDKETEIKYNEKYTEKIEKLYNKSLSESTTINSINTISNMQIVKDCFLKEKSYKIFIEFIHDEFIKQNKWGISNDELLKPIIISLFSIVINEFHLNNTLDDLVTLYNKQKSNSMEDKLKLFISIYTKLNNLKRIVSQKKSSFTLSSKENQPNNEEELLNEFITQMNNKVNFIIEKKSLLNNNNDSNENVNENEINSLIKFLLDFLENDKIKIENIKQKYKNLNDQLTFRKDLLKYLNKILYILTEPQDIKDVINISTSVIKSGKKNIEYFDNNYKGAKESIIEEYKKEVYIFILQLIDKLSLKENMKKLNYYEYDISYYYQVIQSLFWIFKKEDNEFISQNKIYNLFNDEEFLLKKILIDHNSNNFNTINYEYFNVFRLSFDSLYNKIFVLFKLYAFNAIEQLKNNDDIKNIFDVISEILNNYVTEMKKFKEKKIEYNAVTNEEKLNCFLIIFYRCLINNKKDFPLINYVKENYENILCVLFEIFCYSSTKNKIISFKLIELFLYGEETENKFLEKNCELFKNILKTSNKTFYNFIYSEDVKHIDNIFIESLFNLALIFQQNIENVIKFINATESNLPLSIMIIKHFQKIIKQNKSIQISNFIDKNYESNKFILIILQILGVDIDHYFIGAPIIIKKNEQKSIILGYSNESEIVEVLNELNDSVHSNNRKEMSFNYDTGKYIFYIRNESINPQNMTQFNFTIYSTEPSEMKYITNNIPIFPLEKNLKIYSKLSGNICTYEPKEIYFILRFTKNLLIEDNIKLNDPLIQYIAEKSLDKTSLEFKCKIITMEHLEKLLIPLLCEVSSSYLNNENNKQKSENTDVEKNKENEDKGTLELKPDAPDILLQQKSLCYRTGEERSFIINFLYKKIYNLDSFNCPKKFMNIFDDPQQAKKYKKNCILLTKNILDMQTLPNNIKYIIIPENENNDHNIKIENIPIISLDINDYNNITNNAFNQGTFEELENVCLLSLTQDVSNFIDIPIEKIAEMSDNPRDTLLNILEENNDVENANMSEDDLLDNEKDNFIKIFNEEEFNLYGINIKKVDKKLIVNKLISLICRRMLIVLKISRDISVEINNIKSILKLLFFEDSANRVKDSEILNIIKNFVAVVSFKDNKEIIESFKDLSFLDSQKLLDYPQISSVESDAKLLEYENIANNMRLIEYFFLSEFEKIKSGLFGQKSEIMGQDFIINYTEKLIIYYPKLNNNNIIVTLGGIFKHFEANFDRYFDKLKENKKIFLSNEFYEIFNSCNKILTDNLIEKDNDNNHNNNREFDKTLYSKMELIFSFFNIAYKFKLLHNINLNLEKYENSYLFKIYRSYSLLILKNPKKELDINYYNFIDLCYKKNIYKYFLKGNPFNQPLQTIKLNYYDKSFESNFVINYQNLIPNDIKNNLNSISLLLKSINNDLINPENCIFIYESENCINLQDYIKITDRPKDKRILLIKDNFTISYPYKNFQTFLYGGGYNDKNSLGIDTGNREKFSTPQICVGLEGCKNIIDFKFGYYHTFVHSADDILYTCGTEKGSSFRNPNNEYGYFNKATYFYNISKENGGIKGIYANNFNSSILLTKNNKLFCCGKNNTYCLGNSIPGDAEISIPVQMPNFLPVIPEIKYPYLVKEVACGYKSTFFLLEEGFAFTCGSQDHRQCGSKENNNNCYREYFALYPPKNTKFTHVVAGEEFFLLLVEEINENGYGKLYSVGDNSNGRAGVGENNTKNQLQKIENVEDKNFIVIASRNENAAAVTTEGELYTFGFNHNYALGLGYSKNKYIPTKVKALKNYYCDNVGISQNHMVMVVREKINGKKLVFSCGSNDDNALCIENGRSVIKLPQEVTFFKDYKLDEDPMKASLSRYQTYLLSIKVDLKNNINKVYDDVDCFKCKNKIKYCLYFDLCNKNVDYYCQKCALEEKMKIFYVINTVNSDTKNLLEKVVNENLSNLILETNKNSNKVNCLYCKKEINDSNIYQSYNNEKLILCKQCYNSKCPLIEYPQLFISYNYEISPKKINKNINIDSVIYPYIEKTENPYLELEVIPNYKKKYIIQELYKNEEIFELYNSTWKKINKDQLKDMRNIKEDFENDKIDLPLNEEELKIKQKVINDLEEFKKKEEEEKKNKKENEDKNKEKIERQYEYKNYENLSNISCRSNKYRLYDIISKIIDEKKKNGFSCNYKFLDIFNKDKKLYNLAFELSNEISNQIFSIVDLSTRFSFPTIFNKAIISSLELITTDERKDIFTKNIEKYRTSVRYDDTEISLSRIKANLFYSKQEIDINATHTVFGQLFHKTLFYPKKNYLCRISERLFTVKLQGEGSTDYSGPYNEVMSIISNELQSKYLDLFIKTPNNRNDVGNNRDKYMPNPLANKQLHKEMYFFLGHLMVHSIASGNLLCLDLHPIFFKKILKHEVTFDEIDSLDRNAYKFITSLEKIKDQKEFNEKHPELFFAVNSSNSSKNENNNNHLIDLIPDGSKIRVTYEKLNDYIKLYKEFLITEMDQQIKYISEGIFDILPENISALLTPQDFEDFACGSPKVDLRLLRERTVYEQYEEESPLIQNFWKALESFTDEERSKYLKYVWGRSRLPTLKKVNFQHKINGSDSRDPDKRLPTSSTCYFTLYLPNYSSYEILREKLLYVINNCTEIDADFLPDDGANAFENGLDNLEEE